MRALPFRLILLSTCFALSAAVAVYVALDDEDTPRSEIPLLELSPDDSEQDMLTFVDFNDRRVPLSELKGKPVVINFFASWCVPCRTEMPAFEAVHQDLRDDVTFVGVAYNDRPEEAQATVAATGVTYRVGRDLDGALLEHFEGIKMPTTVILDAEGELVHREDGELDEDELRALLADTVGAG